MTACRTILAIALIQAAPVFGQVAPAPFDADQVRKMAEDAKAYAAQAKEYASQVGLDLNLNLDLSGLDHLKSDLAMLQQNAGPSPKAQRFSFNSYDQGTALLDQRQYDQAIKVFDRIITAKSERSDGALYWKAYALNRLGRGDEALASIAALRKDYPSSHWLNDAQVLEAEVKQNAGHPVSPADETNEDIKLMAINSLMNADPDRAIPLLENLLKGTSSNRLKERALFVLTQSKSPKAEQILTDYATGTGNPDLQLRAIRYIGQSGTPEAQQRLVAAYTASNDAAVKEEIVRSLMANGGSDRLLQLARSEKGSNFRLTIVRNLAVAKGTSSDVLVSLYAADSDQAVKRAIVNGLHSRGDAKPLIELARKEGDPTMKKYIVERLSSMRNNKDATDYMLELLK